MLNCGKYENIFTSPKVNLFFRSPPSKKATNCTQSLYLLFTNVYNKLILRSRGTSQSTLKLWDAVIGPPSEGSKARKLNVQKNFELPCSDADDIACLIACLIVCSRTLSLSQPQKSIRTFASGPWGSELNPMMTPLSCLKWCSLKIHHFYIL